jgi:hypothetical protein
MTATDSVRIFPTGVLETKSDFLTQLKSGGLTFSSIDMDQLVVKLYHIAVVTGRSAFEGQRKGKPFNSNKIKRRHTIVSSSRVFVELKEQIVDSLLTPTRGQ